MTPSHSKLLIGVVLAGGLSTRMGEDKGLLKTTSGITWARHQSEILTQFTSKQYISIRQEQFESYSRYFSAKQLIFDNSSFSGPAAGLLSVANVFSGNDLLVLPCDMLHMTVPILEMIQSMYQEKDSFDFYGFRSSYGIEPLAGIYTIKGLTKLGNYYDNKKGLYKFIENANSYIIEMETTLPFLNFNTKDSLKDLP